MSLTDYSSTGDIKIVRAKIDSLSVFEITDSELKTLERGSPSSIYLNFAILLITSGISFFISLVSIDIQSVKLFSAFLVFTLVGGIGGSILLFLWYRERGEVSEVIKTIQERVPQSETLKVDDEQTEA